MGNMKLGLIILLTGIVVVFSVLVLLIIIIKVYSTVVSNAQNSIEAKRVEKQAVKEAAVKEEAPAPVVETAAEKEDDGTIPGEIIAAIAAAVEVIFGEGAVTVTSVRKAKVQRTSKRRSAWKAAGMAENTRAF